MILGWSLAAYWWGDMEFGYGMRREWLDGVEL
jgi:hypothetical protein